MWYHHWDLQLVIEFRVGRVPPTTTRTVTSPVLLQLFEKLLVMSVAGTPGLASQTLLPAVKQPYRISPTPTPRINHPTPIAQHADTNRRGDTLQMIGDVASCEGQEAAVMSEYVC